MNQVLFLYVGVAQIISYVAHPALTAIEQTRAEIRNNFDTYPFMLVTRHQAQTNYLHHVKPLKVQW